MGKMKIKTELTKVIGVNISLQYGSFFGDSLNAMRLQVDTLDKVIPEKELSTFYTSVDPKDYYNEKGKPIAVKAYSAVGPSTSKDETTTTSSGVKQRTIIQTIKLPNSLGDHIFNKYKENKEYFKTPESFIKNVLKGVYIRCTHGDGTILYIDGLSLNLNFEALIESSSGKRDSLVYKSYFFGATKEVIQANHFSNGNRLEDDTLEWEDAPCRSYILRVGNEVSSWSQWSECCCRILRNLNIPLSIISTDTCHIIEAKTRLGRYIVSCICLCTCSSITICIITIHLG